MSTNDQIVIAGAGIGGLSAGLCLRNAGFDVQLVERIDEVCEVGAGILLAPNASNVHYNELELGNELDAVSAPMTHFVITSSRGHTIFEGDVDSNDFAGPCRMIHRAALQRVLYDALGTERVLLSSPVAGFEVDDDGACAITDDGRRIEGRALIGADGIRSVVRAQLVGDDADPLRYHGYTCWRGITDPFEHPDFPFRRLEEIQGRGLRAGMGYIDDERVYWWATCDAPEGQRDDPSTVRGELLDVYSDFPPYFTAMIEATPAARILRNDICDRPPLRRWGTKAVTLLGDAAHPMAPNLGQGACSAIEDAHMLAVCLGEIDDIPTALRRYEQLRRPRTTDLQKKSRRFGTLGQASNPLVVRLREWSTRLLSPLMVEKQQRRLWAYDAAEVYQS